MFNRILNNKNIFKLILAQLMLILLSSCSQNAANKEIHDPLESMNRSVFIIVKLLLSETNSAFSLKTRAAIE